MVPPGAIATTVEHGAGRSPEGECTEPRVAGFTYHAEASSFGSEAKLRPATKVFISSGAQPTWLKPTIVADVGDPTMMRCSAVTFVAPVASVDFQVAPESVLSWGEAAAAGHAPVVARQAVLALSAERIRVGTAAGEVAAGDGIDVGFTAAADDGAVASKVGIGPGFDALFAERADTSARPISPMSTSKKTAIAT